MSAHVFGLISNLRADRPEKLIDDCSVLQRQISNREKSHRFFACFEGIVILLEQSPFADVLIQLPEIGQRSRHFSINHWNACQRFRWRRSIRSIGSQDIEDQHRLLRNHRAPRFGDDDRMSDTFFIANGHCFIDDRTCVLRKRVVHREFECSLTAVIIDSHAAAYIKIFQARAQLHKFDIDACKFIHTRIDLTNVVNLRTHVAVEQLQAILHAPLLQIVQSFQSFGQREPELCFHSR